MDKELYPELPILLVDDENLFLDSMKATLRFNGINNVECCSDGLDVMQLLKIKKFSLILLDILMPGIRGDKLLPLIVEQYPDIPVIIISAISEDSTGRECMERGAFDYLIKPFTNIRLLFSINNALKYSKMKGDRQDVTIERIDLKGSRLRTLLKRKSEDLFKRYAFLGKFVTHNYLKSTTLPYFTNHHENHVLNVEENVYELLTEEAKEKLSSFEIFCLLCACCLHDVGMVAKTEPDESIADVRETHHIRTKQILEKEYLKFQLNQKEAKVIGEICYGHGISNINELERSKWSLDPYGEVNVQFLTALLRIGDLLDFSYLRALSSVADLKKAEGTTLNDWKLRNYISGIRIDHKNREIVIDEFELELTTSDDYDLRAIYRLRDHIECELAIVKEVFKKNGIFLDKISLNRDKNREMDNDEIRYLIENERYWDAISIISKAEARKCADDNTRALKETVIKELSDDEEQSFRKQTKEGKSINYLKSKSVRGRDDGVKSVIEFLDKTPIVTVYGIPGIGKSSFIHELRKSESYNNRLYKRFIPATNITINDLFQQLALVLGCRDMLDQPDFDLSKNLDFSFLETEAQYRVASLIHLDDAQSLFYENRFRDPAIQEFLMAVSKFYPDTRIILESRILPPDGILPEKIHKSIRLHGIDKNSALSNSLLQLELDTFRDITEGEGQLEDFEDEELNAKLEWKIGNEELELILENLRGIENKSKVHPLAMTQLARLAFQSGIAPAEILRNQETLQKFIDESEDLILVDLNQTALEPTGQNLPLNIQMYKEDIPAYLSEQMNKRIQNLLKDLMGTDTGELLSVAKLENELRGAVSNKSYLEGKNCLQEIIRLAPQREEFLRKEFGYIYNFDNSEEDENNWKQKEAQIEWRRKVWRVLSAHNSFVLESVGEEKEIEEPEQRQDVVTLKTSEPHYKRKDKTPARIGAELETPVLILFEKFLTMCKEEFQFDILKKRKQPSGFQFGYDLEFVCRLEGERQLKLRLECKNYVDKINLSDIAGKLLTAKQDFSNDPIDHWILISPFARAATDLNRYLNSLEEKSDYPFKIQVWNQETGVDQFFGLVPEIYDIFYKPSEGQPHPREWSEIKRKEVLESWKQKLEPPLRLPQGWEQYLQNPGKLMLEPKEIEFEKRCDNNDFVIMNCKDETGATLAQTLEDKIFEWLEEPISESPTIFLLGEFGDGKTFFTYVLTRKLVEKFLRKPEGEWLPVRFALKNFESEGFKSIQDFLHHRLKDFRADIAGWNELRSKGYKLLAILDGFDEISKELDPETIQENIDILIDCFESDYFSDMKLLITSRKHFFENHKEKDWLIDKLDKPQPLHLAPIDRKTTEDYLRAYAVEIGEEEKFAKLKECHDPIGMASKPLFLDMVQVSLKDLPEENLNEYTLYETYILKSFERKRKYHYDKRKETPRDKIIENLLNILELVARRLHQSNQEFVYLSDIRGKTDLKEWLWELSDPDTKTTEDETARVATRSLLKRLSVKEQPKGKQWPVDFCHRSMREYFVARAVCNMVEKNLEEAEKFLISCFLSYEILFFASEIMKHRDFDYESNLLHLIRKTRKVEKMDKIKLGYLGGNAVNLLYQYKGKLPGNDWRNLVLDGAILTGADLSRKDFSGTSLQYANIDNVNFTGSDFSHCNLTEVRFEETTSVQSIAISPNEKILALYHDGIIREWSYQPPQGAISTNLSGNITEKLMKLIAHPGNDLTILHDRTLFLYDRDGNKLALKAAIEINPSTKLIKATNDYLLIDEEDGKQNRLHLVDLNKQSVVKSITHPPFAFCDHLGHHAWVIFNEDEELQVIDITPKSRAKLIIPTEEKVACLTTCKCKKFEGQYLLGLGLYNGTVQIWQIQVDQWKHMKLSEQLLHKQGKPIKDISFIDECRIVSGGLDKTIQLFTFNQDGQPVGEPKEFKMTLQCQGMRVDGVTRERIEQKKLQELINKTSQ